MESKNADVSQPKEGSRERGQMPFDIFLHGSCLDSTESLFGE